MTKTSRPSSPWSAALLSVSLLACGHNEPGAQRAYEVLIPQELSTLDPRFSTRGFDIKVTRLVHAGLVGLDASTLAPVPLLASKLHFADESSLDVELRDGIRFHSGAPFEAEDVCATISALKDDALASPHRAVVRAIGECIVKSPTRLRLVLSQPRATLLTDLEVPILRRDQVRLAPQPAGELDGLGPFQLVSSSPTEAVLTPAPHRANSPRRGVIVRTVRDENARALRLLAGRADVAPGAISPTLLPAFEGRRDLAIISRPGANVTYLLLQNDRAPLDRRDVRRALAQAIDREKIVKTLLTGRGQVADWIFPPGHWAHTPATALAYDPAAARAVLAGQRPLTLLTSTDRTRVTFARAIAQMMGDAGLSVRVVSLDFGVLLARLDSGDFDMATLQMPELTEPHLLSWFFHPKGVPGEGGIGKNRARWRHPNAARWLDAAGADRDTGVRREFYGQLASLMREELPVIPLWHEDQVAVVSNRARGFMPSAEGRWASLASLP
ncbi:MAG: ABC transporter substrate-binding protein [Polyangiaceae bacterium]